MKNRAFTLVELMIVMGLIGILSAVVVNNFMGTIAKGRDARRKDDLKVIAKGLESFANDFGKYPDSSNGYVMGCKDSVSDSFKSCGQGTSDRFRTYREGVDEAIVYINTWPTDPVTGRTYRYDYDSSANTYSLYAALENTNDKDVKQTGTGQPDPAGWAVTCGTSTCNYKLTESGVIKR